MNDNYLPSEGLEHVKAHESILERTEHVLLRYVPLLAAILAVCAGLSSLYAGRLSEETLMLKNEAVLDEVRASDLWNEYQAESLKAHLARSPREAKKYRDEQKPLRAQATQLEAARDDAWAKSTASEDRKSKLDVALAIFEVSIVLASIAAMVKFPSLFVLGGLGGIAGLLFAVRALFGASS